jgi:hypothetical protein
LSTVYVRFAAHRLAQLQRSPLLEKLVARASHVAPVADWRAEAYRLIAPGAPLPSVAAALLHAGGEARPAPGSWVCVATPVHFTAGMSSVTLPGDGVLRLRPGEAQALAADFLHVFGGAEVRLSVALAPSLLGSPAPELAAGLPPSPAASLEPSPAPSLSMSPRATLPVSLPPSPSANLPASRSVNLPAGGPASRAASRSGELLCVFGQPMEVVTHDPEAMAGRDVFAFQPIGPDAPRLRRLMSELEMWLFDHEVNRARAATAQPSITGLWLWGGGPTNADVPAVQGWTAGDDPFFAAFGGEPEWPRAPGAGVVVCAEQPGSDDWIAAEQRWLAPAAAALRAGRIERLALSAGERCYSVTSGALLRFWRRPQPWWESFGILPRP